MQLFKVNIFSTAGGCAGADMAAGGKGMSRSASQLLLETVNGFLGNAGGWQPVLAIIKGLRNGAV